MRVDHRQGLEALLFLAAEPVPAGELAEAIEVDVEVAEDLCQELAETYRAEQRGLAVRRVGGGWRMYTAEPAWPAVERHVLAGRTGRLSSAALETLAVIAYKQPVTRSSVSEVRGVNADGAVRSLIARGYVEEVGRSDAPGQPVLLGTTGRFLEDLGLDDLDELPDLADFLVDDAPDEPDDVRAARQLLASGGALPGATDARRSRAEEARERRARDDESMDDLTTRLEQAARSAMDQLRTAVDAAERVEAGADGGRDHTDTAADGQNDGHGAGGSGGDDGAPGADEEDQ